MSSHSENMIKEMIRVPIWRFKREMRKWLRFVSDKEEVIIITRNGNDLVYLCPINHFPNSITEEVPEEIKGVEQWV